MITKKLTETFMGTDEHERQKHPHIYDDKNALVRTMLANQRTFLAYLRTALTIFVTGVGFLKFFDTLITDVIGWAFIPIGVATFLVGIYRYNELRVRMKRFGRL